jgi:hypothetical protein
LRPELVGRRGYIFKALSGDKWTVDVRYRHKPADRVKLARDEFEVDWPPAWAKHEETRALVMSVLDAYLIPDGLAERICDLSLMRSTLGRCGLDFKEESLGSALSGSWDKLDAVFSVLSFARPIEAVNTMSSYSPCCDCSDESRSSWDEAVSRDSFLCDDGG